MQNAVFNTRVIPGTYNVGYLPFQTQLLQGRKRKRGRPPKNRSLSNFTPGRASPMPVGLAGIPGSSFYTLKMKKKRGRPPKRKVGLPPVFVVPQQQNNPGNVTLQATVPKSGPLIIPNIASISNQNASNMAITSQNSGLINQSVANVASQNLALVNHGLQIGNTGNSGTASPQLLQCLTGGGMVTQQSTPNNQYPIITPLPQHQHIPGNIAGKNVQQVQNQNVMAATTSVATSNGIVLDNDKQSETDYEESNLISQDVMRNIIEKLSDEKSIGTPTPPPSQQQTPQHPKSMLGNSTLGTSKIVNQQQAPNAIYLPVGQSNQVLQQQPPSQLSSLLNAQKSISSGNSPCGTSSPYVVLSQPSIGNVVNNSQMHSSPSKPHISLYEKQFENFIHQGKFQSNVHGQVVYNVPNSDMVVFQNNLKQMDNNKNSEQQQVTTTGLMSNVGNVTLNNGVKISENTPCNMQQSPIIVVPNPQSQIVHETQNCDSTTITTNSSVPNPVNTSSEASVQSKDGSTIPNSNPTSPDSSVSESDLNTSSKSEGGTTPTNSSKKLKVSSSVIKEQKRNNLNKLTEKLHSLGEKKKGGSSSNNKEQGGVAGVGACNESNEANGDGVCGGDPSNNGMVQQKKSVTSSPSHSQSVMACNDNGTLLNNSPMKGSAAMTTHCNEVFGVTKAVIGSLNKNVAGQFIREQSPGNIKQQQHQENALSSLQGTMVPVINVPTNAVNGRYHKVSSTTGMPIHQQQPKQAHVNGVYPLPHQAHTGPQLQNNQLMKDLGGMDYNGAKPARTGVSNKKFARLAQKRKQQAVQRLNNKNKGTSNANSGSFYVGVNVFNYPYIPQQGNNVRGDNNAVVYKDYGVNVGNNSNSSDKPLDFSLKKKQ